MGNESCKNNNIPVIKDDNESEKEEYVVNIIHDLRSHLNVILSAAQVMEQSLAKDKEDIKYIEMIKRNSYKMLKLVNNLVDTNKLSKNYYNLNRKNTDLVPLLENTISEIAKYAAKRNVNLIFDTNEEECEIFIDPDAIDRVLMNLLSNAIKFSKDGSNIYITVNVEEKNVSFSVKDEGCGISEDEINKIFNRFYQGKNKDKNSLSGSGIGLNLCYYFVKAHNGKILIDSHINKGSTFTVVLPRKLCVEKEAASEKKLEGVKEKIEIEFSDI